MSPAIFLTPLILISAGLHIRAEYRGPRTHVYIFKPLTTILILLIALLGDGSGEATYKWLIVGGLLFSLGGDIFLMLPQDRFLAGLVSFLIAHLFYIAAFTTGTGFSIALLFFAPLLIYGLVIFRTLWPHLGPMKIPATLYMVVILVMAWQAGGRWLALESSSTLLATAGALLFVASDSTLALDRFRRPFPSARAITLVTYFAAQWLIAVSSQ